MTPGRRSGASDQHDDHARRPRGRASNASSRAPDARRSIRSGPPFCSNDPTGAHRPARGWPVAGRRRFVRLIDRVQMEFGVCFTTEDWDRGFSLAGLIETVEAERRGARATNAALPRSRLREARATLTGEPVKFGLLAGALLAFPILRGQALLQCLLGGLWATIVVGHDPGLLEQHAYARRLVERLGSATRRDRATARSTSERQCSGTKAVPTSQLGPGPSSSRSSLPTYDMTTRTAVTGGGLLLGRRPRFRNE